MSSNSSFAEQLRVRFRVKFGIDSPKLKETKSVSEWTFLLADANGRSDAMWCILHSPIPPGSESNNDIRRYLVNQMSGVTAQVALSVRAINNVPTWQFVGIEPTTEEETKLTDPLYPPEDLHRRAAMEFLNNFLLTGDSELVEFLALEHERLFGQDINYGFGDAGERFDFKCIGTSCLNTITIPTDEIDRYRDRITSSGGILCPRCGELMKPPDGAEVEGPNSPLGKRFGSRSERTPT